MPPFLVDPPSCIIVYSYTVSGEGEQLVSQFDPSTQTFTFENLDNYALSGSSSSTYKFTINAVTGGTVSQQTATATFNLKAKHPCQDTDFKPYNLAVSPNQRNPSPYFYSEQGMFIQIESFVADPPLCPVSY